MDRRSLIGRRGLLRNSLSAVLLSFISVCGLAGCNDISKAPPPDPGPGVLTIVTTSLPDGLIGQPYATTVGGSGGITPYTWSVTPSLPTNLLFDQTTGVITGTPTAQGTTSHTFTLQDSSSPVQTVQTTLSLTINTAPAVLSILLHRSRTGQSARPTIKPCRLLEGPVR